jgi:NAD(P)H-nitrite reductase large subunit
MCLFHDMIICRCEEITKGEIRRAIYDGMYTLTEIRRYLRTGMGLCQGQTWEISEINSCKRITS